MTTDRTATITIGGDEYTLVLTTKATKEIAGRYGGLENLGDKLMKNENFEMAIGEIVWLITLLANQALLIHNLKHKDDPKELLTEDMVELTFASPSVASAFQGCLPDISALLRRIIVPSMVGVEKVMLSPLVARLVAGIPNLTL